MLPECIDHYFLDTLPLSTITRFGHRAQQSLDRAERRTTAATACIKVQHSKSTDLPTLFSGLTYVVVSQALGSDLNGPARGSSQHNNKHPSTTLKSPCAWSYEPGRVAHSKTQSWSFTAHKRTIGSSDTRAFVLCPFTNELTSFREHPRMEISMSSTMRCRCLDELSSRARNGIIVFIATMPICPIHEHCVSQIRT